MSKAAQHRLTYETAFLFSKNYFISTLSFISCLTIAEE